MKNANTRIIYCINQMFGTWERVTLEALSRKVKSVKVFEQLYSIILSVFKQKEIKGQRNV